MGCVGCERGEEGRGGGSYILSSLEGFTCIFGASDGREDARGARGAVGTDRAFGPMVVEIRGAARASISGGTSIGVLEGGCGFRGGITSRWCEVGHLRLQGGAVPADVS